MIFFRRITYQKKFKKIDFKHFHQNGNTNNNKSMTSGVQKNVNDNLNAHSST